MGVESGEESYGLSFALAALLERVTVSEMVITAGFSILSFIVVVGGISTILGDSALSVCSFSIAISSVSSSGDRWSPSEGGEEELMSIALALLFDSWLCSSVELELLLSTCIHISSYRIPSYPSCPSSYTSSTSSTSSPSFGMEV